MRKPFVFAFIAVISFVILSNINTILSDDIVFKKVIGLASVVTGIALYLFSAKIAFDRTNEYGTQIYSSFSELLTSRFAQIAMRLSGAFLFIFGVFQLLAAVLSKSLN